MVALEAAPQRLASTRADFHTGPGAQALPARGRRYDCSPLLDQNSTTHPWPSATTCHVATAASRPSRPSGGALRAALTRPTRRGPLPVCDEGKPSSRATEFSRKDGRRWT